MHELDTKHYSQESVCFYYYFGIYTETHNVIILSGMCTKLSKGYWL